MHWYSNLYLGERLKNQEAKVKSRVERNVPQPSLYLLTLPSNEENLLDIIPEQIYYKRHIRRKNFLLSVWKKDMTQH